MGDTMKTVKIPRLFWEDSINCDTNVPDSIKETRTHVWITMGVGPQMSDFMSRAEMYADIRNGYWESCRGLVLSARATLKAIKEAV